MKSILLLLVAGVAHGQMLKLPTLKTTDGKVFEDVTVTAKRPDGISIMHKAGSARIPFEKLPWQVKDKLGGFDKQAAQEARQRDAEEQAANEAAIVEAPNPLDAPQGNVVEKKAKRVIPDKDKLTVKPVLYQGGKRLQITAQADEDGLMVAWGRSSRTFGPWESAVFYVGAGDNYRVSAYENGVLVDQETSRGKTGLGSDYKLR